MGGNFSLNMGKMISMLIQTFKRKIPFAAIYDDRSSCLALEILSQLF